MCIIKNINKKNLIEYVLFEFWNFRILKILKHTQVWDNLRQMKAL